MEMSTLESELLLSSEAKCEETEASGGSWTRKWCSVDGEFAEHAAKLSTFVRNLTFAISLICTQVCYMKIGSVEGHVSNKI